MEFIDQFIQSFDSATSVEIAIAAVLLVAVWFLPAIVAIFFNRKQVKLIAVACVPAGLSVIAWSGLMIWAFTGNMTNRFVKKPQQAK